MKTITEYRRRSDGKKEKVCGLHVLRHRGGASSQRGSQIVRKVKTVVVKELTTAETRRRQVGSPRSVCFYFAALTSLIHDRAQRLPRFGAAVKGEEGVTIRSVDEVRCLCLRYGVTASNAPESHCTCVVRSSSKSLGGLPIKTQQLWCRSWYVWAPGVRCSGSGAELCPPPRACVLLTSRRLP